MPSTILEVFHLLFTEELLESIADNTNLYAAQCMGEEKYLKWSEVTLEEMKAFFGLVQLPALSDYWSTSLTFRYTVISEKIPRKRFFDIMQYLHFVDNTKLPKPGETGYTKLGKVQPVVDHLNNRFQHTYNVSREVSIDEAMIPFKGRSSLKQYMPMKPTKRGIKVWGMADANNGFMAKVQVYTGKSTEHTDDGLGARVIKHLTSHLQHR